MSDDEVMNMHFFFNVRDVEKENALPANFAVRADVTFIYRR